MFDFKKVIAFVYRRCEFVGCRGSLGGGHVYDLFRNFDGFDLFDDFFDDVFTLIFF